MCSNTQPAFQSALLVSECGLSSTLTAYQFWSPHRVTVLLSQEVFLCSCASHMPLLLLVRLLAAVFSDLGRVGVGVGLDTQHWSLGARDTLCGPGSDAVLHVEGCQANEL